ncbi:hypothetical protein [Burkholderia contaminans]|uniref:hypothetical protein n=1 Tax=Burkholderia contaminans TaxID=488447 RepID=UPI000F57F13A|nr:hypothetical protein [Burkholderia contaminans]
MKHHILIAGTGRAGTSFLVQYLAACGLDTHLARNPEDRLDENANAGLEDFPTGDANLPYVIKSPWLYEFVDDLLARDDIQVDAVIIPMRDLVEAATSRVVNELRARLGHEGLPNELTLWHTWGSTPGGVVYSLNPIDQARLLSMGFHRVIHACVKKRVPLVFMEFPRFITDGEYLYEQLRPILNGIDFSKAMLAHARTAQPDKVRIGGELANSTNVSKGDLFPNFDALDRVALHREITNARRDRDICRREAETLRSVNVDLEHRLEQNIQDRDHWKEQAAHEGSHRVRMEQELEEGHRQHESLVSDMRRAHQQQLEETIGERDRAISELKSAIIDLEHRLEANIKDRDHWKEEAAQEGSRRIRMEQELEDGRRQHESLVSDMQRAHLQQLEEAVSERDCAISDLKSTIVDVEQRLEENIQDRDHWKEQAAQEGLRRVLTEQKLEEGRRQYESLAAEMQRVHQQQLEETIGERDRAISYLRSAIVDVEHRLEENIKDRDHWKEQAVREGSHRVRLEMELKEGRRQHESLVSNMQRVHLEQLKEAIGERDRAISDLKSAIVDVEHRLEENIQDRDHWKKQAALEGSHRIQTEHELEEGRRQHESLVSDMQRAHLQQLEEVVSERDRLASDMAKKNAMIEEILTSASWRITDPLRKLHTVLRRK